MGFSKEVQAFETEGNLACFLSAHWTSVGKAKYLMAELMLIVVLMNVLSGYPDSR